jgi:hypothetical protein
MKKQWLLILIFSLSSVFFSACYQSWPDYREIRTKLMYTNAIGIAGESSEEPYIEIQYSIADEENPGINKTASIMVSPPYVFQNDKVYVTYEYIEIRDNGSPSKRWYTETLLHDFGEGGAEYLRIINHSDDKPVEFFLAGSMRPDDNKPKDPGYLYLPSVHYKRAPIYFLLFPEYKFTKNGYTTDRKEDFYYFEGDRCGDLILTSVWTANEVAALYRAEYTSSNNIRLVLDYEDWRIIDLINGKIAGWESFKGNIFYGTIKPKDEMRGNKKIWLLSTWRTFFDDFLSFNVPL